VQAEISIICQTKRGEDSILVKVGKHDMRKVRKAIGGKRIKRLWWMALIWRSGGRKDNHTRGEGKAGKGVSAIPKTAEGFSRPKSVAEGRGVEGREVSTVTPSLKRGKT